MLGRDRAGRGGRVRGKVAAIALSAGLAVSGALIALPSSTAGAAGADPLGPTIAQLEASYAAALANTVGAYYTVYWSVYYEVFGPLALVPEVECLVLAVTNPQPFGGPCGR